MSLTYGIDVQEHDDPYITAAQRGGAGVAIAGVPGAFLVESLPFLKYIPEWVPGAGFQRKAKEWKEDARLMIEMPYAATVEKLASDNPFHSTETFKVDRVYISESGKWNLPAVFRVT